MLMNPVIKRAIDWCFEEGNILKDVALSVLQNALQNKDRVQSLQFMSLKSIMRRKMEKDIYANCIFSLVFKEPVNLYDFMDRRTYQKLYYRIRRKIQDKITKYHKRRQIFLELRKDPHVMLAAIEQNMTNKHNYIEVRIARKELRVISQGSLVALIPHRDNLEYDTYWGVMFLKMFVRNHFWVISFGMDGEGIVPFEDLSARSATAIATINPVVPSEGWKAAFEQGGNRIYVKNIDTIFDDVFYVTQFTIHCHYNPNFENHYWGSIETE